MTLTRLRDLVEYDRSTISDPLLMDEVAMAVFGAAQCTYFVRTTVGRSQKFSEPRIPNFELLGENEQYLVTKLLRSNETTIHLTGGIGVGKTRFLRFFQEEVLPTLRHPAATVRDACPMVINVDCEDFAATTAAQSKDPEEITGSPHA